MNNKSFNGQRHENLQKRHTQDNEHKQDIKKNKAKEKHDSTEVKWHRRHDLEEYDGDDSFFKAGM